MDRRTFTRNAAVAALAAAVPPVSVLAERREATGKDLPFSLSVMLWTVFQKLPFEERLARVAEAGYSKIELVGEYRDWTSADFERANSARKQLGIEFDATAGLRHGVADPSTREAFLAELTQALKPMETLGCPAMIVLSGNVVAGKTREEQHLSCIETLKRAAAMVEGRSINGQPVRLLLECIDPAENPNYFLQSASEAIEIVRAVHHPQVQFLYDLYHEQIAEGNLLEKLEKHIDVIGLIHVADVPGRHEPGTGEINYTNIYRKLLQLNYRQTVAMEFYPSGDPVETLRAARVQIAQLSARNAK